MGKISAFYTMPHPPIVIPEIGRGEEKKIQRTTDAFNKVAEDIARIEPDTIIIVTPHGPLFNDAIAMSFENKIKGNLGRFSAPQVNLSLEIDIPLTRKIIEYSAKEDIITVVMTRDSAKTYDIEYELDHGSMVPLYFINKKHTKYKLVHITYGMLPKMQLYKFGMCIKKAVEDSDKNAVFIASGDLSHMLTDDGPYGYSPYGEKFDNEIISLLKDGDVLGIFNMDRTTIEKAGECGLRSYYVMLGAMNGYDIKGNLLSYEGTFGVGYSIMSFSLKETNLDTYTILLDQNRKRFKDKIHTTDPYIRLARESLTHYLMYGEYMNLTSYVTEEMKNHKRGVFVSLKNDGQLRGCVGTIFPTTKNIAQEIIRNAVEAGLHDPRFIPVTEDELEELDFSVDVLTEPEMATKEELDPKKYGVIVRSRGKSGLLLPDLEGVDTVEEQLSIALQKGRIFPYEDYTIEKFEVIRHNQV
ncbi:AmmeMemoRadiSam system protein A [Proteiniborus sp.]|uniref:AmmeMemoRadiSam system protein A n=1 Tax=Proteiniborus sp. TaxID=2079015 RepID=UPI00332C4EA6